MATGATNRQPDPREGQGDQHKLLSDDEFAAEAQKEFVAEQKTMSVADASRQQQIWQSIERRLVAADGSIRAMTARQKTLVASLVMAASAAFAGIYIAGSLQSVDESTAIKGSDSAKRVITVSLKSADPNTANVVVTSPSAGWLTVFIRHGDSYTPWITEAKLEPGDTPFYAIDHPLPAGMHWPAADKKLNSHNVCAIAVTHRSALTLMASNIAKLWPSFTDSNCLY